jgi:hydroxymethylglutaryl-CoA lyase
MKVKIVECPRDAMQGFKRQINTEAKVDYINTLLDVGFDVLDCGSFVSAKAVPQMADTREVLKSIKRNTQTKLLVIIANTRGAKEASEFDNISYLGFPFSVSEEFQLRNTNKSREGAFETLKQIQAIAGKNGKELVVYISMGFGNPYNETWNYSIVSDWTKKIIDLGVKTISLSDTIGIAKPMDVKNLFSTLIHEHTEIEFGAHFHTRPENWKELIEAAWESGCRRFDGAIKGYGGCPMATDKLTGNLPTEDLILFLKEKNCIPKDFNLSNFQIAYSKANTVFNI